MAAVNVELVFFRIFVRLTHGIRGTCSPSTRFVIRAALLLYTLAMVAVLSYLHFAFVSEPSALAGLIARAASEAERGGGFHILEVTMTEASSGVAFELPNGTRTVWEAPDTALAADSDPASWQQHHGAPVEWMLRAAQGLFGGPSAAPPADGDPPAAGARDPAAAQADAFELATRLLWAAVDQASPAAREVLRLLAGDWWWAARGAQAVASSLQGRAPARPWPVASAPEQAHAVQSQPLSFQIAHRRGVLYIADDNDVAAGLARRGGCNGSSATGAGAPRGACPGQSPHARAGAEWLRTARLLVPENYRAFGSPAARTLLRLGGGQDVPFIVAAFDAFNGSGFVRAVRRRHVFALSKGHDVAVVRQSVSSWLLFKFGTLCSALFVVSAATGLTSFVFNETQRRMVRFTLALGHAVQRRRPVLRLVIAHSVESLVFVPIMIGLLFFMFEFFGDKLLAFLVFMALWACEVFAVVACRTVQSVRVFPVTALLCLTWLMVYVLVFPFGLHHLALACVFSALTCSAYHQWTSFELPALEHGRLSEATPRETIVVSPAQGLTADLIRNLQRGSAVLDAGLGIGGGRLPMQEVIAGMAVGQPAVHLRQAQPDSVARGAAAAFEAVAAPAATPAAATAAEAAAAAAAAAAAVRHGPSGAGSLRSIAGSGRASGLSALSSAPPSPLARGAAADRSGQPLVRDVAAETGIEDDDQPVRRRRPVRAASEASASAAHTSAISALGSLLDTAASPA
ncbi:hypothetical protein FNF27_03364 [Cafeteria roenbergensis]|uniref:Uncharacterized protein n=1 Tax=Cafeteria roenbergensis TaxID=33653 RepID=A0A5A8EB73_CAFRO|nr:hypothetical protein FNF27_03364 [Cafeteria roenbergensis]